MQITLTNIYSRIIKSWHLIKCFFESKIYYTCNFYDIMILFVLELQYLVINKSITQKIMTYKWISKTSLFYCDESKHRTLDIENLATNRFERPSPCYITLTPHLRYKLE